MVLGLFSGKKSTQERALAKAKKLSDQARWAEALGFYEEARDAQPSNAEAADGVRRCREQLVGWNLEEAKLLRDAQPDRALEHARLALELAGEEKFLRRDAQSLLDQWGEETPAPAPEAADEDDAETRETPAPRKRMFEPSCGCASLSCHSDDDPARHGEPGDPAQEAEVLFDFYMEGLSEEEQERFETLGEEFRIGYVALQQERMEVAHDALERAEAAHPENATVSYVRGLVAGFEGDMEGAERLFAQACQRDAKFGAPYRQRCMVLRELGRSAEAAVLAQARLSNDPDDEETRLLCVAALLDDGRAKEALALLEYFGEERLKLDPTAATFRGRALEGLGDLDGAVQSYQFATARNPKLLEALIPMGSILIQQGGKQAEAALKIFKHCYRIDPERGWYYLLRLAEAYGSRGWAGEAQDMLQSAQEELPEGEEAQAAWERVRDGLEAGQS